MKRLMKKLKQNSAFTLQELLIAVAVLVVLMGISIPLISNLMLRLKMAELDNHAKTIYLEAQNQIAELKVEGGLEKFSTEVEDAYSTRFLTTMPHDFDAEKNGEDWNRLCYLSKGDDVAESLISHKSNTYLMQGDYLIELNPATGDVYSVFYWEKSENINYATHIEGLLDRTSDERSSIEIGYYGGQLESTISEDFTLGQKVEVINGEELYIKISYNHTERLAKYYNFLKITYKISDEHGNTWEQSIAPGDYTLGERIEYYVLLDSMAEGLGIAQITEGKLVAGDNLTITVKGEFKRGAYHCIEENAPIVTNSLFAKKTYHDDTGMEISLSALRHVKNMSLFEGATTSGTNPYIHIKLTKDIDFENKNYAWNKDSYKGPSNGTCPIESLSPITNDAILNNEGSGDKTTIDGNSYKLKNFVIEAEPGTTGAGLFAYTKNVDFTKVYLEDITILASGYEHVGALAGTIEEGILTDCGVYLTTYQMVDGEKIYYAKTPAENNAYTNAMEERYATRIVSGGRNVGGLVGTASSVIITDSFSAIQVKGSSVLGGIAGKTTSVTFENCYASGDVSASGTIAGGFVGNAIATNVVNAYSTANIYATDYAGGFVGTSTTSSFTTCHALGQILDVAKENVPLHAGGFCYENTAGNNLYNYCKYLAQEAYNSTGLKDNANVTSQGYAAFYATEENALGAGLSYPYDNVLLGQTFPFVPVVDNHYGNWPQQYVINNSLVYYEKYEDGTYGYYCETTLTDEASDEQVNQFIWVLDTLKDEVCIEDGYAILSMNNLSKFSYELRVGSDESLKQNGTLTVVDSYSGNTTAVNTQSARLRQQGAVTFYAYESQMEDYSKATPVDQFIMDGMYLYQLPYKLQCTDRYNIENFYDRLIIYAGYAVGNDEAGATPILGGTNATSGVSFFYSPHFAKTAVNPNTDGASSETLLNPEYVYVRSARQLNALGRYPYYWNDKGGLADKITYVQECDINFGTYGSIVNDIKLYCGVEFDLMDVESDVANVPIGVPDLDDSYKQFRNVYDGQGNRIIDYRVKSNQIFTGLFGEIRDAVIRNVVMTVSKPGEGYVISTCHPTNEVTKAGVGALVGLSYMHDNTIENCSVSGYKVEYTLSTPTTGSSQIEGLAVGGLVGFSMSEITNCSAENDVKITVSTRYSGPLFVGGLAGSAFFEPVSYSYSGGTIDIELSGSGRLSGTVAIGGVCPGYYYTWYEEGATRRGDYDYLYSYTEVLTDNYSYLFGTVGDFSVTTERTATLEATNCYYLSQSFADGVSGDEMGSSISYTGLMNLSSMPNRVAGAEDSYPYSEELVDMAYPFPTVITSVDGKTNLHYGDWPLEGESGTTPDPDPTPDPGQKPDRNNVIESDALNNRWYDYVGVFYYESYDDDGDGDVDSYGIYAVGTYYSWMSSPEPAVLINTLGSNQETILEKGYGVFYKDASNWDVRGERSGWNSYNWINMDEYGKEMNNIFPSEVTGYSLRFIETIPTDTEGSAYTEIIRYTYRNSIEHEITIPEISSLRPN